MKRDWQSCAQATRGCGYGDGAVVKTLHWHTENPSKRKRGLGTPDRLRRISRPASKNASLFWFKPPAYKVRLRFNSQRKKTKKDEMHSVSPKKRLHFTTKPAEAEESLSLNSVDSNVVSTF